jgi:hypothetical protein
MNTIAALAAAVAIGATALSGCQQLFTTSLGTALARSDLPIPKTLTKGQASDLAAQAKDNPALASQLTTSLVAQLGSTPDPATESALMGSAAIAAVSASKTSEALTSVITDFATTGSAPSAQVLTDLLTTIQSGASGEGVVTALKYLDPNSGGLTAAQAQEAGLGATDLAIAAVVIASTIIPVGSDPTALDVSALSAADQATLEVAKGILASATTLAGTDTASTDLLNSIAGNFSLPAGVTIPTTP